MHELSLLGGVVDAARAAAGGASIKEIHLLVGTRSGVVVQALEQAWPLAIATAPELSDTLLTIETINSTVFCPSCQREQPIDEYFALRCPVCDTPTGDLRRGTEFQIAWIDVERQD